jgi:PTH1 family peptidyl-tRNA hydrolase
MNTDGLIVGLGNPGQRYAKTRHNIGFMVINTLVRLSSSITPLDKHRNYSLWMWKNPDTTHPWMLCQPRTYMNLSGKAVKQLANKYALSSSQILVVHDDLDFSLGQLRFKFGGGCAGHKGLLSIAHCLGSFDFSRLRIGIGRPERHDSIADYVLSDFKPDEGQCLDSVLEKAFWGIVLFCKGGLSAAMREVNSH